MKTRMYIIVILMGLACLSKSSYGQSSKTYLIEGKIDGLPKNITLYLITTKDNGNPDTVETIKSTEGRFLFNSKRIIFGKIHFVKMDTSLFKLRNNKTWIRIVMDSSNIQVSGKAHDWPEVTIGGSLSTKLYNNYFKAIKQITIEFNELELLAKNDTLRLLKMQKSCEKLLSDFISENQNSIILPLIIKGDTFLSLNEKEFIFMRLPLAVKNSFYGKQFRDYIAQEKHEVEVQKKQKLLAVGKQLPDFNISTSDKKSQSVLTIVSKSEYTLIDFWASWCGPCRDAIPKIKDVYDTYRTKGFNVLAISTDKNEIAWKNALGEENTKWDNGWDNIDNAGKNIFGLAAIPAYILVNKKGIIIQTDYFSEGGSKLKIKKIGQKTIDDDLKEIIDGLLGDGKGK